MIRLERILVPTDFSEHSDAALKYARALAGAFGARLHLLHVVQDPYSQPWAAEAFATQLGVMVSDWESQARKRMAASLPAEDADRATIATAIGSPFQEIIRCASQHDAALIVMGTHGRGAIGHALLGSVAERVVRKAPCPVLTVRQPEREFVT